MAITTEALKHGDDSDRPWWFYSSMTYTGRYRWKRVTEWEMHKIGAVSSGSLQPLMKLQQLVRHIHSGQGYWIDVPVVHEGASDEE